MKKLLATILCLGTFSAVAADLDEAGRLDRMNETLQKQGVDGFLEAVRENGWKMTRIPSKWFADTRATNDEERRQMRAARDFGYQLAVQLDKLALEQQALPPENVLYRRAQLLCDTGSWLTETAGYGNVFLARRCLDLAAVGLARLTGSLDFPVVDCEKLAARMRPEWMGMAYSLQVLNGEAGTNLFVNASVTNEELDRQWAIGWTMRAMAEKRTLVKKTERPNASFVNIQAFTNNLGFFVSYEFPQSPVTLLRSWDLRQHRLIAIGLELQSVKKALALLEYRSVVGFFPEKFIRSEEERLQLEKDIRESAKWGMKITPMERDSSFDPMKESFRRAWLARVNRDKKEDNHYVIAVQAYHEITDSRFYDSDTAQMRSNEPMPEWQKARFDAEEKAAAEARMRYKESQGKP